MHSRTVFVIGAGASKEAGLPVGRELVEIVAKRLSFQELRGSLVEGVGDADILDILQQHGRSREVINTYLDAARRVREGVVFSNSIDSFIDAHREDAMVQFCGKLAIVKTILDAEQHSKLLIDGRSGDFADAEGLKGTWFFDFARNLNQGIRKSDINRIFEKVSFIIFNYDRCFEHFMYQALKRHFALASEETASIMAGLNVIHPYGTVADLPWADERDGIPFGFTANRANMQLMASRIKTYTEQIEDDSLLKAIRHEISAAAVLVFLGFSYHAENMKLLYPGRRCDTAAVYGTALGFSSSNIADVGEKIRALVGRDLYQEINRGNRMHLFDHVHIENLSCASLLQEYSRSLFASGSL